MAKKNSNSFLSNEAISITIAITTALSTTLFAVVGGLPIEPKPAAEYENTDSASKLKETADATSKTNEQEDVVDQPTSQPLPRPTDTIVSPASTPTPVPVVPRPNSNRYAENMRLDLPELEFEARFPAGSSQDPAYTPIIKKISKYRDRLKEEAIEAKASASENSVPFEPWSVDIVFREIQREGNVVSAMGREYSYTSGAHPNLNWQGLIAEADTGREISLHEFFLPRVGVSPALAIAACEEIRQAKLERIGEATIDGDDIDCANTSTRERIFEADLSLTASTEPDKFGGILFMFSPYEIGAYVEGPYTVVVDQEIFNLDLRPEYAALFDGKAKRPQTN